jgi:prepilin-type N-terminal cleavage/methylation domain-containing protein
MKGRKGFTILELLVSVVVVSTIAATTIPAFFDQPGVTLENASVLLARDLRAAQNRSAYMAESERFVFRRDGDGYVVTDRKGSVILNPRTHGPFSRRYSSDGVFRGVEVANVRAGRDWTLIIDDRGRPVESATITLRYQNDTRIILVEKGSGDVTIVGSTSGWNDRGY